MINRDVLMDAVEWVEAQAKIPEIDREWDQGEWLLQPDERAEHLTDEYQGKLLDLYDLPSTGYDPTPVFEMHREIEDVVDTVAEHCGTAFCVAGYIAQKHDSRYRNATTVDGVHVSMYAAEKIGLDLQPNWYGGVSNLPLFEASNSAEDIRLIAESMMNIEDSVGVYIP